MDFIQLVFLIGSIFFLLLFFIGLLLYHGFFNINLKFSKKKKDIENGTEELLNQFRTNKKETIIKIPSTTKKKNPFFLNPCLQCLIIAVIFIVGFLIFIIPPPSPEVSEPAQTFKCEIWRINPGGGVIVEGDCVTAEEKEPQPLLRLSEIFKNPDGSPDWIMIISAAIGFFYFLRMIGGH